MERYLIRQQDEWMYKVRMANASIEREIKLLKNLSSAVSFAMSHFCSERATYRFSC